MMKVLKPHTVGISGENEENYRVFINTIIKLLQSAKL